MPGCSRKPSFWALEASLLGPLPASRRYARLGRACLAAAVVLLVMPVASAFGAAATLNVQNAAAPPDGQSLSAPVMLSVPAGIKVAALQFDVEFDPAVMALAPTGGVLEGTATKAAGKQISFSKVAPDRIRVLVVGLNAGAVADGEVARLNFSVSGGALSAVASIHVKNAVLADPNGSEVPVQTGSGEALNSAVSQSGAGTDAPGGLSPTVVILAFGCLAAVGVAAGIAWRRHARERATSGNCRKKSATRCAAGKHG